MTKKDPEMVFSKRYFMYGVIGVLVGAAIGCGAGYFLQWLEKPDLDQRTNIDCTLIPGNPQNYWNYTGYTIDQKLDLCKAYNRNLDQFRAFDNNAPLLGAIFGGAAMVLSLFVTLQIHLVYKPGNKET